PPPPPPPPPVPLSPDEIQKQAASAMGRIEMAAMDVQGKLQKATDEGDAVKVDCLSDKLSVIRTREKAAKDRLPLLEGALRVKDTDQAATFLLVIQKHREESEKAQAQAAGCIGSDLSFLGETKSTMTRDPELPQDNGQPPAFLDTPGWGMDMPPASDPSASL
ncbi:MAG: hypothetical protein RMJ98_11780, partial [Myxococcales bacterium]|nr:hypothetical protein [Myxococcales bacterium]